MLSNYLKHTIVMGDNPQNISQDMLGDANRWIEIVMLNNLEYPFITEDPSIASETVKTIGDTIVIPVETQQQVELNKNEIEEIYEKSLGYDLDIFGYEGLDTVPLTEEETGQVSVDIYGDLKVVKGVYNLKQALLMRLATPVGALLRHPEYGSNVHTIIGKRSTDGALQLAKGEIERTIRCDERVESVSFREAYQDGDIIKFSVDIKPVDIDIAFRMSLEFGEEGLVEWA